MSNRKRINLSISASLYGEIAELANAGGFNGPCAFLVALVEAFSNYSKQRRADLPKERQTIAEEINEMFAGLEDEGAAKEISRPTYTGQKY